MKFKCGGFLFTSDFDSGNLDKVEHVEPTKNTKSFASTSDTNLPPLPQNRYVRRQKSNPDSPLNSPGHTRKHSLKKKTLHSKLKSTVSAESICCKQNQKFEEFNLWTKPDCSGTPHQTSFRTWFYFGLSEGSPGANVKLNIMNLNRQGKLYFHGMKPVYKVVPSKEGWKRIPEKVDFRCSTDGNFIISFCHTLPMERESVTYFAFTYPFSYSECQNMLNEIDEKIGSSLYLTKNSKTVDSALYYSRELLCYTKEGNKIELLTVTSCKGLTMEREKQLPHLFPDANKPRCHIFRNKKIVFISSRVHPGETPSSFVFNGMLHNLIGSKDTIATRLRNLFVFKLIPMLNPDGVLRGHYRADLHGLNLNRIYMVANLQEHPAIYAARTLLLHYHTFYSAPNDAIYVNKVKKPKNTTNNLHSNVGFSSKNYARKTIIRKHSLHTCETITQNLNFLSSVPVLPVVTKGSGFAKKPFQSTCSSGLPVKTMPDPLGSTLDACNECALSEYPSKKITVCCDCIEASDADDSLGCDVKLGEGDASKLLKDVPCIQPEESGIAYYFDLHGHASKRGCFIYGNHFPDVEKMVDCMFLPKLMSINCPYFDFSACNFSAENMYSGSTSNIQSKEGSGRVSLYVLTGIIHSYTLECNYNTCRYPTNQKRNKKANTNVPSQEFFTPEIYEQIGESLLISILDAVGHNPRSQVSSSQFMSLQGVKEWLKQHALSLRGRCVFSKKLTHMIGSRSSEKISTRSMTIRRSLFSPSNKGLQQESSSEGPRNRKTLSSPKALQRRHTFMQDAKYRIFRKPTAPSTA